MAPSSSARKVAKLASRGKGKKVRFSGGTTFPAIVTAVVLLMVALVAYGKLSLPSEESGAPQPGDSWHIAYGIKVCDEYLPPLQGTADELNKDASTGDQTKVNTAPDRDGVIHYHPQTGGNTGKKAKLSVFLDIYDIKLTDTKLELPVSQVGEGETRKWDINDGDVFKGTPCEGKDAQLLVRVWDDYTQGAFQDKVTAFGSQRFTRSGMVFSIAIIPDEDDFELNQPDSAARLGDLEVIGEGSANPVTTDTGVTTDSTASTDSTPATDPAGTTVETTAAVTTTTGG
ncbi:MAG: hypothetical protein ABMA25_20685 [Ilumatobacteraceae bacterium]